MTTSAQRYREYKLVLHRESNDHYRVAIFDPNGKRVASTGTHLERQGALAEASRYVEHLLAQGRATMKRATYKVTSAVRLPPMPLGTYLLNAVRESPLSYR
jgi:hypothetical protein